MPDGGAATHGRPLCRCHGEPMDTTGNGHECAVKRRARLRATYHANPAAANYARTRRALRARIPAKRRQIEELERRLEEKDTG